jgi:hypothetical protein
MTFARNFLWGKSLGLSVTIYERGVPHFGTSTKRVVSRIRRDLLRDCQFQEFRFFPKEIDNIPGQVPPDTEPSHYLLAFLEDVIADQPDECLIVRPIPSTAWRWDSVELRCAI